MDYLIGAGILVGCYLVVLMCVVARKMIRRKKSVPLLTILMRDAAEKGNREASDLWTEVAALGPLHINVTCGTGAKIPPRLTYVACALRGLDHMIRYTNIDPLVMDTMIQTTIDLALKQNHKDKGESV